MVHNRHDNDSHDDTSDRKAVAIATGISCWCHVVRLGYTLRYSSSGAAIDLETEHCSRCMTKLHHPHCHQGRQGYVLQFTETITPV